MKFSAKWDIYDKLRIEHKPEICKMRSFLKILRYISLFSLLAFTECCEFPPQLRDVWKGADRGDVTFTNSTRMASYTMNIPGVAAFDFLCLEKQGNTYYLKAEQENNIFGVIVKFYMCLDIHVVDDDVAYYYHRTAVDPFLQDNIVGDANNLATFSSVCSETRSIRNFVTLVKDGAVASGSMNNTCPEQLQAQFDNVSIQHAAETEATICPGTVFDVCTDKTLINITYNETCATTSVAKTLSAGGIYRCIHSVTEGSETFLAIWNDDDGVANPFSCFAFRRTDDTIYATETPKFCSNASNSETAETGGVKLIIWDIIGTCEIITTTTPETPVSMAGLWALMLLPFILLLLLVLLLARRCYRRYGCICKKIRLPKRKKKEAPVTDDGTGKADIVGKTMFVPSVIKPAKLYNFRPKKPLNNFFPLFDPDWNPTEVPNLQPVAKVEPLYNDTLDDYMRGRLPRRPSGASLYSFHSGRIANGYVP